MQSSIQRMVSDGTLQFIDLAIEYIDKVNVKVSVDDVPIGAPGSGTPYTYEWITDTRIKITPVVPLAGIVILRRVTPTLKMYHVYDDGATFNDFTMDENFKQLLFIGQEAIDGGVATDFYSDINIHGYRIKASADGIEPTDLVTVRQYQADANGAFVSRTAAEAAAAAALVSQNTATASATAAGNSQTAAAASAAAALSSQNAALSSQNAAAYWASAASTIANNAQESATAAAASYDSFDDRYLGAKTSNPTLDNDGSALLEGALYWNTVAKEMRVYNGTAWVVAYLPATGYLEKNQNLADLVNASTARSNLGLGTAATANLTTSNIDATVGRVLKVGDFGLGVVGATPVIANIDSHYLATGLYWFANGAGTPPPATYGYVLVQRADAAASMQTFTNAGATQQWVRYSNGSVWSAWVEVFTQRSILGTVSQSAGVPTGAIIERGSNANGEYVRYADGTQICTVATSCPNISEPSGPIYRTNADTIWTFPSSFIVAPAVSGQVAGLTGSWMIAGTAGAGTVSVGLRVAWHASLVAAIVVRMLAIGRWY